MRVVNGVCIIEAEEPRTCEFCGAFAECRPYADGGRQICFRCGQQPQHREEVKRNMLALLDRAFPTRAN